MFGISLPQLLIILVIVLLLFGTSRLRNLGSDLGGAIRGFRSSMGEDETTDDAPAPDFIEGEAKREPNEVPARDSEKSA
ncbi:MAG: twin-arginine translocase TatA/TatE family subunit [Pseudomonadota bacterium]|nr:twin-arginine translocase TatA/TatE family subunit [Pseudomonadota bacterium]